MGRVPDSFLNLGVDDIVIPDPSDVLRRAVETILDTMNALGENEELIITRRKLPGGGWTMTRRQRADSD